MCLLSVSFRKNSLGTCRSNRISIAIIPFGGSIVLNHAELGGQALARQPLPRPNVRQISDWREISDLGLNVQCTCRLRLRDA